MWRNLQTLTINVWLEDVAKFSVVDDRHIVPSKSLLSGQFDMYKTPAMHPAVSQGSSCSAKNRLFSKVELTISQDIELSYR